MILPLEEMSFTVGFLILQGILPPMEVSIVHCIEKCMDQDPIPFKNPLEDTIL